MSNSSYGSDLMDAAKSVQSTTDFSDIIVSSNDERPQTFDCHKLVLYGSLPFIRHLFRNQVEVSHIVLPVPKFYLKKILDFVYQGRTVLSSKEEEEEFLVHAKTMGLRNIDKSFPEEQRKSPVVYKRKNSATLGPGDIFHIDPIISKSVVDINVNKIESNRAVTSEFQKLKVFSSDVIITSKTNRTMVKSSNSSNNIVNNSLNAHLQNQWQDEIEEERSDVRKLKSKCEDKIEEEIDMSHPSWMVDILRNKFSNENSDVVTNTIYNISKSDDSSIIITPDTYSRKVCMLYIFISIYKYLFNSFS